MRKVSPTYEPAGMNAPVAPLRQEASGSLMDGLVAEAMRSSGGVAVWAIGVLIDQGMPWTEIGSILGSEGPELVRRTLELHRERLVERLAEQRAELDRIEPLLLEALVTRWPASPAALAGAGNGAI